jgi:hypothetical protein
MRRTFQVVVTAIALVCSASQGTNAIELTCIEASRYRHLYQLFGGDPRQLAAFLQLDPTQLPRPEHCRAMLLSGMIEGWSDVDTLLTAIDTNQGWLAVLHLASGGGNVPTGYGLGFLTRLFWLKTQTAIAFDGNLSYTPDFFVPPAAADDELPDSERIHNWQHYLATQKGLGQIPLARALCASACGLIHTAGIDRAGRVNVHRARLGRSINLDKTMSETDRRLLRLEQAQLEFYRRMDPGPEFFPQYQATPTQMTTPTDVARFPRYMADYLTRKCTVNGDQMRELDRQINNIIADLSAPQFGYWIKTDHLRHSLRQLRTLRAETERCIAAAHESERRSHFAKLCPNGCDRTKILRMVEARARALNK